MYNDSNDPLKLLPKFLGGRANQFLKGDRLDHWSLFLLPGLDDQWKIVPITDHDSWYNVFKLARSKITESGIFLIVISEENIGHYQFMEVVEELSDLVHGSKFGNQPVLVLHDSQMNVAYDAKKGVRAKIRPPWFNKTRANELYAENRTVEKPLVFLSQGTPTILDNWTKDWVKAKATLNRATELAKELISEEFLSSEHLINPNLVLRNSLFHLLNYLNLHDFVLGNESDDSGKWSTSTEHLEDAELIVLDQMQKFKIPKPEVGVELMGGMMVSFVWEHKKIIATDENKLYEGDTKSLRKMGWQIVPLEIEEIIQAISLKE